MTLRNPSEIARLEEERLEILRAFRDGKVGTFRVSSDKGYKSGREALLAELRDIERTLGIPSVPYNSTEWSKQYDNLSSD